MLTKNKIKIIRSLANKKERYAQQLFIIEGEKIVQEAIEMEVPISEIVSLADQKEKIQFPHLSIASKQDMERCSALKQSPGVLALVPFLTWKDPDLSSGKYIVLDGIKDPGNLGTIIRIADWFEIDGIFCSNDSVDVYNQKVVQASMGSIFRIPVWYRDLPAFLSTCKLTKMAADMEGEDFASYDFPKNGLIVMGSESHGISDRVKSLTNASITIQRKGKAESLNVSVAAGIICERFSKA
jgi:TrmH family RNA methyltransferase